MAIKSEVAEKHFQDYRNADLETDYRERMATLTDFQGRVEQWLGKKGKQQLEQAEGLGEFVDFVVRLNEENKQSYGEADTNLAKMAYSAKMAIQQRYDMYDQLYEANPGLCLGLMAIRYGEAIKQFLKLGYSSIVIDKDNAKWNKQMIIGSFKNGGSLIQEFWRASVEVNPNLKQVLQEFGCL